MSVAVLGAGAFGTALAITLAQNGPVLLWARDPGQASAMAGTRENVRRLPGVVLPENISVTADLTRVLQAEPLLLALPMQEIGAFLQQHRAAMSGKTLIACCKGIDLETGQGPSALIGSICPTSRAAILTGPGFAADIARGLPTALTLACAEDTGALQAALSTPTLRLYRTGDMAGAELGGALKNVYAIAAGTVIGAGLGDSARAALMTRSFAEMTRIATTLGARSETLSGLSGFGDLVLTCTSPQSRNFRLGEAIGAGRAVDPTITVEGIATAKALTRLAQKHAIDMPVARMVTALIENRIRVAQAVEVLLSRPLKEE